MFRLENYETATAVLESYIENLGDTNSEEQNKMYLEPVLQFCLCKMREEYTTKDELYKQNELYHKCMKNERIRRQYPKYNINRISVFMEAQTEEFQKVFGLFETACGYLKGTGVPLRVSLNAKYDQFLEETYSNYGSPKSSKKKSALGEEKQNQFYSTYIQLKVLDTFLYGEEKDISLDNIANVMFGKYNVFCKKAYYTVMEIDKDGNKLTDEEVKKFMNLQKVMSKYFQGKSLKTPTDEELEEVLTAYQKEFPKTRAITNTKTIEKLISCTPEVVLEVDNTIGTDKETVFELKEKTTSAVYEDKEQLEKAIMLVEPRLIKACYGSVSEEEQMALLRKAVLTKRFDNNEKMAKACVCEEFGKRFEWSKLQKLTYDNPQFKETTMKLFENIEKNADKWNFSTGEFRRQLLINIVSDYPTICETLGLDLDELYKSEFKDSEQEIEVGL